MSVLKARAQNLARGQEAAEAKSAERAARVAARKSA
jgi:hypothetical protein